jgi:hypothetical protein
MIQLTTTMVEVLSGLPITIVVMLMIERQPLTQAYLRRHLRCSDHTIQDAIDLLNDYHLLNQTGRYTWQLADGVQQLPLGMDLLPDPEITPPADQVVDVVATHSTEKRAEEPVAEIRSQYMRPNSPLVLESKSSELEKRLKPDLVLDSSDPAQKMIIEQNLAECKARGINEPARSKISQKLHVTPEYIRYVLKISDSLKRAVGRMLADWDWQDWKEKSVSMETVNSDSIQELPICDDSDPVDDQADSWWSDLVEKLREQVPRSVFLTWVQPGAPARRIDDALVVLAGNELVREKITENLSQAALDDMAKVISGGSVNRIKFVTSFEKEKL